MAWQTEMVTLLRHVIGDLSEDSPTYSDERLQELILASAQLVQGTMTFSETYTVDIDEVILSPDPTETTNKDNSFINLIVLKAACIIDNGAARLAAGQAIEIADYSSRISLKGMAQARLALLKDGWCKQFDDAKLEFELGGVGTAGEAVLGPYRTAYSSNPYDTNGDPVCRTWRR